MRPVASTPTRLPPPPLPVLAETALSITAAILGVGAVYRATLSLPVTLIAAALAAVVAVAGPTRRRVYLYPARYRDPVD